MPAIDIINCSSFFADEIAGNTGALEFDIQISSDTLELLIKMLYEKRISDIDVKSDHFFELIIATYNMDFTDILDKILPYTKEMIETQVSYK